MSVRQLIHCPRCGARIRADETLCPACLLAAGSTVGPVEASERIFQEALTLPPEAWRKFIIEKTGGDAALLASVEMLLKGFEESGADSAGVTDNATSNQREEWTCESNEQPGTLIHHFRLVQLIGEGGMGSVWRAEQTSPVRRDVALKLIKLGMDTRDVVKRFQRERQTLALLNHPNIAQVFEAGATALGRPYFAMELVEGKPITTFCQNAGLEVAEALEIFRHVCAAVEHAHQKGVIHRDIKPSNILVGASGVKVIDFGVAKATQNIGDTPLFTRQAQILGTPAYMSPEQARSAGVDIDTRTDVYSLGVVLYELLTGVLPIDSDRLASTGLAEMQRIILEEEPPTPSTRVATISSSGKKVVSTTDWTSTLRGDLDWIVMKAIRKERDERYSSAAALSEDLRRFVAGEPVSAVPPTLTYTAGKFIRRHRATVASAAVIFAALLIGLIVSLFQMHRANVALAGEANARKETTLTLSDMYLHSGLEAAKNGDVTRAELWFANATLLATNDPARREANRLRATAWRDDAATAIRAFDTGYEHLHQFIWNPQRAALIVDGENERTTQIWDLETEQKWEPASNLKIRCAAWDSSGDRVAIEISGDTVLILEFPSGKELARHEHMPANSLEWSPDNRWIATGNSLWDWQANAQRLLPQNVSHAHFSRDGNLLLMQWDLKAGVCAVASPDHFLLAAVPAHSGDFARFLGDGSSYVVGNPNGGLTIYDSKTGATLSSETNGLFSGWAGLPLDVSADGSFIARSSLAMMDRENPVAPKFPKHQGQFTAASFSPDNSLLASGGYDNRLELWSVADGKFLGEVGHHHTGVVNVTFSPDGKFIASGEDGLVRIWRIPAQDYIGHIPAEAATLTKASPDGKFVVASGFSNQGGDVRETQLFDIKTSKPAGPKIIPDGLIMDAVFGTNATWLALALSTTQDRGISAFEKSGGSGNIQFWNPMTGEQLDDPIAMPSEPRGICLHPDGRFIGVYCAGGEGVEIDLSNRTTQVLFNLHKFSSAGATLNNGRCAYSPDGRVFAAWGMCQFIHLWDRQQAREIIEPFEYDNTTFDLAFHDHIVARAVLGIPVRIEFRDELTGAEIAPAIPFINWPFLTRFSEDGNLLLTAGGGRNAQVWDWRHGRLICPMLPHDETIMAGCFVPGTPWVITGGHDGKIKFWDRNTGMMIRPPIEHDGWVLEIQVTPDANTLIASGFFRGGIELIDLKKALPTPTLEGEAARLLAEIDADAEIHPGGGLAPLTPQAWLKKWQQFRKEFPRFNGHSFGG